MSDPVTGDQDERRGARFDDVGREVSEILQRAASVLEEEVAVGAAGAKKLSARAFEERRIDPAEFEDVMQRFRVDLHDVVDVAGNRLAEMSVGQPQELTQRFATDAHDVVDTVMNLVNLAPDILNRLAQQLPDRQRRPDQAPTPEAPTPDAPVDPLTTVSPDLSTTGIAGSVTETLARYRELAVSTLLADLPTEETPHHFYDLVSRYPSRPGKGLRAALCLATCAVGGGEVSQAVNAAATIELFHNAFLIYDDIQDESELRRGSPTLSAEHGVGIALNVGNATNLLALSRLNANRRLLGSKLAWRVFEETQLMLRHSLEGQAIELAWIRDNVCELTEGDYLRMCLKKTSWYTTLYPCRIGTLIAGRGVVPVDRFDRYGWFLGAAFQIQDDILNLVGDAAYGKEIAGDLWEGKRTLMLIRLLNTCHGGDLDAVRAHLARSRAERSATDVARIREQMITTGGVEAARVVAQELAVAARHEAELALAGAVDSEDKEFLLGLPAYVTERDW